MEIVDLSLSLHDGMITYPSSSHCPFESSILGRLAIEGRETRKFTMGSHCGTHIDAPKHFLPDALAIDDIALEQLQGKAWLIDLTPIGEGDLIDRKLLQQHLPDDAIEKLVVRTDWSENTWNTSQFYVNWPTMTDDAIDYILERKIHCLAIDFPSPDPVYCGTDADEDCKHHKTLFRNNCILAEYLTNLKSLKPGWIFLNIAPLKLKDFDGAPSRVTAYQLDPQ